MLAKCAGVEPRRVSWSGLKDRHAVCTQHFSIHLGNARDPSFAELDDSAVQVLSAQRHDRKLRHGAHRQNAFWLRLRGVRGEFDALAERLESIEEQGVPNYFGPQRFGREGGNLRLVARLASGERLRRSERGFALSAARAVLFNHVLAARVRVGAWAEARVGDRLMLAGSRSHFAYDEDDTEIAVRVATGELDPTGPLWGRAQPPTTGEVLALEKGTAEALPEVVAVTTSAGMEQERRRLRMAVHDLECERAEDGDLVLSFRLEAGAFATTLLSELGDFEDAA